MDLEELTTLAAASLLAGSVRNRNVSASSGNTSVDFPSLAEVTKAVKIAQEIWAEVLRQKRAR
jgi:hypothetical protein